jgi:hypothetical protein
MRNEIDGVGEQGVLVRSVKSHVKVGRRYEREEYDPATGVYPFADAVLLISDDSNLLFPAYFPRIFILL